MEGLKVKVDILLSIVVTFFATLIGILFLADIHRIFDPPLLLPLLNTLFLALIPAFTAFTAARAFLAVGSLTMLLLVSGMLALASGGIISGWFIGSIGGPNVTITIYNSCVLLCAVLLLVGKVILLAFPGQKLNRKRGHYLILSFVAVVVTGGVIAFTAASGLTPLFIVQGVGPTLTGRAVLLAAIACFAVSAAISAKEFAATGVFLLRWYSAGLLLLAIGLTGVLLQKAVGSPIGWAGRVSQYFGACCILVGVLDLWRFKIQSGMALEATFDAVIQKRLSELELLNIELNEIIAEQKNTEDSLHKITQRYDNLVARISVGIYLLRSKADGAFALEYVSPRMEAILDMNAASLLLDDSILFAAIHPEDRESFESLNLLGIQTLQPFHWQGRFLVRGAVKWLQFDSSPEPLGNGEVLWHGIIDDITERKNLEHHLQAAKDAAESDNRSKSEFLANMSHEIRTPMNAVIGISQLLELTALTPEQQGHVSALKQSSKSLMSLISDILDLSKIEAGKITIYQAEFSLEQCIINIIQILQASASEKGLTLELDFDVDVPPFLLGDEMRVKQILINLIGNSVKFTSEGGITISVQLLEQYADSVILKLRVSDTGIGIWAEAFDRIFLPFVQEDGSIIRCSGGTGLGLTICRRLTELLGGSINVESSKGIGSCFTVILPFTVPRDAGSAQEPSADLPLSWDGPPLRILMVEDDPVNIKFGTLMLSKLGHESSVARNGRECLAALEQSSFDIVLMDIQMPVMNGEETLREIRRQEQGTCRHQPVIALTAFALRGEKERLLSIGFDSYVSKPVEFKVLVSEMKRILA